MLSRPTGMKPIFDDGMLMPINGRKIRKRIISPASEIVSRMRYHLIPKIFNATGHLPRLATILI